MSIKIENLNHIYMPKTPFEKIALNNINCEIEDGEFVALIGHTGSGKSTFIQHLNGLLSPTSGNIIVDGVNIADKKVKLSDIRKKVGLVFQYPEYQLFEETIEKDIEYGPRNLGISEEEISKRVKKSMEMVGLDYETYKDKSPFDLSGGQKRRVAIAGVIAINKNTGLSPLYKYLNCNLDINTVAPKKAIMNIYPQNLSTINNEAIKINDINILVLGSNLCTKESPGIY